MLMLVEVMVETVRQQDKVERRMHEQLELV
jgi:hypothetical protein